MANSVIFSQGEALIAGTLVVPVSEAGARGELQIDGGAILRPLTFGERTRIVSRAATNASPALALTQGILQTAQVQPGGSDVRVLEILALALAGADEEAPPFMEAALRVAKSAGWSLAQIYDAEAAEVDRFAVYLGGQAEVQPDDGWNRIVFLSSPASTAGGDTLEDVCRALAERLLLRADASASPNPGVDDAAVIDDSPIKGRDEAQNTEALYATQVNGGSKSQMLQPAQLQAHDVSVPAHVENLASAGVKNTDVATVEPGSRPRGYIRVRTQPAATTAPATPPASRESTPPSTTFTLRRLETPVTSGMPEANGGLPATRSPLSPSEQVATAPQRTLQQPARVLTRSVAAPASTGARVETPTMVADTRTEMTPLLPAHEPSSIIQEAEAPAQFTAMQLQIEDLADVLAEKLNLEADLRGLER